MALRDAYASRDEDKDDGLQVLIEDLRTLENIAWRKLKHILQLARLIDVAADKHTLPKLEDILALGTEKAVIKFSAQQRSAGAISGCEMGDKWFLSLWSTAAQWGPTYDRAQQAGGRLASLTALTVTAAKFPYLTQSNRTCHAIALMSLLDKKQMDVFTLDTWTRFLREDFQVLAKGVYLWDANLQEKVLVIGVSSGIIGDAPWRMEFAGLKQASALSWPMCHFRLIMCSHGNGMLVQKRHRNDAGAEECECVQPRGSDSRTEVTARALHVELKEGITEIARGNGDQFRITRFSDIWD
ncbi:hypothetical protein BDK51DRAFT_39465 [Blyttiomyces helicus]|uniref:Uncharacterized protein n=1 Tax=Blyttiomyces helicus TaxID=388810 RepID=A0A4P9WA68_9FUNG|nr:hypothetical protein BDK51DRAFT_39465 [Blyttiomyces helicus]|eukprot:RKO88393.1 hypothetical protein BDK51DRAFT_39465 [Blyttiomyces helicus]